MSATGDAPAHSSGAQSEGVPRRVAEVVVAKQHGHGHAKHIGDLVQGPDRQVLAAAFDALKVLERDGDACVSAIDYTFKEGAQANA
jgi:hypothetical protein